MKIDLSKLNKEHLDRFCCLNTAIKEVVKHISNDVRLARQQDMRQVLTLLRSLSLEHAQTGVQDRQWTYKGPKGQWSSSST